jgi:hypothetical protein
VHSYVLVEIHWHGHSSRVGDPTSRIDEASDVPWDAFGIPGRFEAGRGREVVKRRGVRGGGLPPGGAKLPATESARVGNLERSRAIVLESRFRWHVDC